MHLNLASKKEDPVAIHSLYFEHLTTNKLIAYIVFIYKIVCSFFISATASFYLATSSSRSSRLAVFLKYKQSYCYQWFKAIDLLENKYLPNLAAWSTNNKQKYITYYNQRTWILENIDHRDKFMRKLEMTCVIIIYYVNVVRLINLPW